MALKSGEYTAEEISILRVKMADSFSTASSSMTATETRQKLDPCRVNEPVTVYIRRTDIEFSRFTDIEYDNTGQTHHHRKARPRLTVECDLLEGDPMSIGRGEFLILTAEQYDALRAYGQTARGVGHEKTLTMLNEARLLNAQLEVERIEAVRATEEAQETINALLEEVEALRARPDVVRVYEAVF